MEMEYEIEALPTAVVNELYEILGLFVPIGLLLACGLMFIFITMPNNPLLNNYRKMRYVMAFAYLLFIPCLTVEYVFRVHLSVNDVVVQQVIYLTLSSSQAFLFTLTFLSLLDVKPLRWQRAFRMAAPIILFIITIIVIYRFCSETCFDRAFYLFLGGYAVLLAYYTRLFFKTYKGFRYRMDNYFSDCEAEQMCWIKDTFFVSLTVGTVALVINLFMTPLTLLIFSVGFAAFYLYFAIRFINYAYRFHTIKHAMDCYCTTKKDDMECCATETVLQPELLATNHTTTAASTNFSSIEKRIEQWIEKKGFTEPGITMDILARKFYTNRSYLSNYINVCKQKTFREWINYLRIEEAKLLMRKYPEKTISEIAVEVGIPDKTYFRRHFVSFTGNSPKMWRSSNSG